MVWYEISTVRHQGSSWSENGKGLLIVNTINEHLQDVACESRSDTCRCVSDGYLGGMDDAELYFGCNVGIFLLNMFQIFFSLPCFDNAVKQMYFLYKIFDCEKSENPDMKSVSQHRAAFYLENLMIQCETFSIHVLDRYYHNCVMYLSN